MCEWQVSLNQRPGQETHVDMNAIERIVFLGERTFPAVKLEVVFVVFDGKGVCSFGDEIAVQHHVASVLGRTVKPKASQLKTLRWLGCLEGEDVIRK